MSMSPPGYTYHPAPYLTSQPIPGYPNQPGVMRRGWGQTLIDAASGVGAGLTPSAATQVAHTKAIGNTLGAAQRLVGYTPQTAAHTTRMATAALRANPLARAAIKFAAPVGAGLAIGDVVMGDESWGNRGMDAALMTAGGFLGSAVPVVGTAAGIAAGKMVSDGAQWLFGDKLSPEQRRAMEMAKAMNGGMG